MAGQWKAVLSIIPKSLMYEKIHNQSPTPSAEQEEPFISGDDHPSDKGDDQKRLPSRLFVFSIATVVGILLISWTAIAFVAGTAYYRSRDKHEQHQVMVQPCGTTPLEARQRGCRFDIISFCWLPERCYDAELSDEYERANKLEWFLDANRTEPLTREQIMTGEHTGLYVNWDYHMTHCTAMWKKMHRAIMSGSVQGNKAMAIDGYIGAYTHTTHCEHMLLEGRNIAPDVMNTRIAVKYPDCGLFNAN